MRQVNTIHNHIGRILELAVTDVPNDFALTPTALIIRVDSHHPPLELTLHCAKLLICSKLINRLCFRGTDSVACINDLWSIDWDGQASDLNCDVFLRFIIHNNYKAHPQGQVS